MNTKNLSTLKIHKLTKEQYERELAAGNIDENALYLTPDEEVDLSVYATVEQMQTKADLEHEHQMEDVAGLQDALADTLAAAKAHTDTALSDVAYISENNENVEIPYVGMGEVVIYEGDSLTLGNAGSFYVLDQVVLSQLPSVGDEVTLVIDGVSYTGIVKKHEEGDSFICYVGNLSIINPQGVENTGESYLFVFDENNHAMFSTVTFSSLTISVMALTMLGTITGKTGWLEDKDGNKFAPKILTSQVQTSDGVLLEDKMQSALDGKAENGHTHDGIYYTKAASDTKFMTNANPVGTGALSLNRKAGTTVGANSAAFGAETTASGSWTTAEGLRTRATWNAAHAEGIDTYASQEASHAEGKETQALGMQSHTEGWGTIVTSDDSVTATPVYNSSYGLAAHAEGINTVAIGSAAHAEGIGTLARGIYGSHAEGFGTVAGSSSQHAQGKYNVVDESGVYAHIVGNGSADDDRSNAHTLDWNGNAWFKGNVKVGGTGQNDATGTLATTADVDTAIHSAIVTEGTGEAYTATVPGITELVEGVHFMMRPHVASTSTVPTLNVNGLGAKEVYRSTSRGTLLSTGGYNDNWLGQYSPVLVVYSGFKWVVHGITQPLADDLYGEVPISKGGTGATTAAEALTNLGIVATAAELNHVHGVTSNIQTQLYNKLSLFGGTMTGAITYSTESGNTKPNNYISAGGGYSAESGRYGVKLLACDQNDCQSGLGQDLTGLEGGYELTVAGGRSTNGLGYISFALHDVNSKDYTRLGHFDASGNLYTSGSIYSNGSQVATVTQVATAQSTADSAKSIAQSAQDAAYSAQNMASGEPRYIVNRNTAVNAADTNYTTLMARGISLNSAATTPAVNGAIALTYG